MDRRLRVQPLIVVSARSSGWSGRRWLGRRPLDFLVGDCLQGLAVGMKEAVAGRHFPEGSRSEMVPQARNFC